MSAVFGDPTNHGPCGCCGGVTVSCPGCGVLPEIVLPTTLLVTINTPGTGSTTCVCPYSSPLDFYNGFIPAGGDGTTVNIVYDSGLGYWTGTFTACDSSTAEIRATPSLTGDCRFDVQILNPNFPSVTNITWGVVLYIAQPGLCTGDPLFVSGSWIASASLQPCDLQGTVQA